MSETEYYTAERRSWWERLMESLTTRRDGTAAAVELPSDSLFAGGFRSMPGSVADVPEQVKSQIREEAVLDTFNRLEASLRLLLHATTPGKEPTSTEKYQQILNVWRYELEQRVNLLPDTYCGAVIRYAPQMEEAYTIDGRCAPGDLLRIRVPCWRMNDRIVVRGEAEIVSEEEAGQVVEAGAPAAAPGVRPDGLPDEALSPEAREAREWMQREGRKEVPDPLSGLPGS